MGTSADTSAVPRPALTPLLFAACGAWAGCLAAEACTWQRLAGVSLFALAPAAVLAAVCALAACAGCVLCLRACGRGTEVFAKRARALLRGAACPLLGVVCGFACGALCWGAWPAAVHAVEQALAREGAVEIEVTGDAVQKPYGIVSAGRISGLPAAFQVRVLWPDAAAAAAPGTLVRLEGVFIAAGADERGRWNHRMGYLGMLKVSAARREGAAPSLRGALSSFRQASAQHLAAFGGTAAALLSGVLLGDRALYAGTQVEADFRACGLAHLMAVSGTHLAVVTALVGGALSRTPARRLARTVLLAIALLLYAALTGFAPSAVRACCMCVTAVSAGAARRRPHGLSALSLCVLLFSCAEPTIVFSTGFQLSVLAILGLLTMGPLAATWAGHMGGPLLERLAQPLAASCAATALTVPLSVALFAQLPLIGPFATMLAAPLVTIMLGLGICGLLLACPFPAASQVLLGVAGSAANACAALAHILARLPFSCVPICAGGAAAALACIGCLVALWVIWPLPRQAPRAGWAHLQRLGACACLAAPFAIALVFGFSTGRAPSCPVAPTRDAPCFVTVDVGQGDCSLIREGSHAVLVDTGEDGKTLLRGMARQGITHLDAVFITHKDKDHCGALSALAGVVGVDHVFVHADLVADPVMQDVRNDACWVVGARGLEGVRAGDSVTIGHMKLTMLAPEHGGASENSDSLVHLVQYDADLDGAAEAQGLITGDAESEDVQASVRQVGDVDFIKVAHHGSRGAVTRADLQTLRPEVAVIGVGADNDYGHPTQETLSTLAGAHVKVYRTDIDGDITLEFTPARMSVRTRNG